MIPSQSMRPGKAPAYPWFAKDTKSDVECAALDATEYGVYIRLLEFAWINYGIPSDENFLTRLAKNSLGVSAYKWKKIWKILRNFFEERDGFLFNPRQEEERSSEQVYRANQKRKSKLANIARWNRKDLEAENASPDSRSSYPRGDHPGIPGASPSLSISSSLDQLADCVSVDQVNEDETPPEPEITPPDEDIVDLVRQITAFDINGVPASSDTVLRIALILRDREKIGRFVTRWKDFCRRNTPSGWGIVVELAKQTASEVIQKPKARPVDTREIVAHENLTEHVKNSISALVTSPPTDTSVQLLACVLQTQERVTGFIESVRDIRFLDWAEVLEEAERYPAAKPAGRETSNGNAKVAGGML